MLNKTRMIEKCIFGIQKVLDMLLHFTYLFPKNASNLEGKESNQTNTVMVAENAAING
jgi:hypothetical protein